MKPIFEYNKIESSYLKYPHLNFDSKIFFKFFRKNQFIKVIDDDNQVRLMKTASGQARITKMGWWFKKYNIRLEQKIKITYALYNNEVAIYLSTNLEGGTQYENINSNENVKIKEKIKNDDFKTLDEIIQEFSDNNLSLIEKILKVNNLMNESHIKKIEKVVEETIRNDTKLIQLLKELAQYRCQFPNCCNNRILKRDGKYYIEVAHIKAVNQEGLSKLGNLIVLCPNHHKEFDLGKRDIKEQTPTFIKGFLNDTPFSIELF